MKKTFSPLKAKVPADQQGTDAKNQKQLYELIVPKRFPHFNYQTINLVEVSA